MRVLRPLAVGLRLLACNVLLKAFVVHVEIAHGFLLNATGQSFKLAHEGLVVDLELILHLTLFVVQIVDAKSR